ncbi:MAG: RNA polymerase sigma factor [Xanthomonadales bacterium]|nr:RNA polymerase sigma factor [Xanthomonadales bacterium]HRD72196.1 RNA polymerase sigma factor [Aquimonas sp.]
MSQPLVDAHVDDPDLALLRAAGLGDQSAALQLVRTHAPALQRLAWRMLGDEQEAQDVVQESCLRLWRVAGEWRPGEARISTWLHTVAMNLSRDRLRRRRETYPVESFEWLAGEDSPEQDMERDRRSARVQQALTQLPERQREALILSHFEGYSQSEAASVMGVSVEALESLLSRARRSLRQRWLIGENES